MAGVLENAKLRNRMMPDYRTVLQNDHKMVLTAVGEVVYRRKDDGVFVVPIGCLKP